MDIDVPASVAYNCYSDREAIPRWMPFISSVKILEDKPDLSQWSLKYEAFGRDIEFSWLARNMQPIPNQKIHWRSLDGVPNRGVARFFPKGPSSCVVERGTKRKKHMLDWMGWDGHIFGPGASFPRGGNEGNYKRGSGHNIPLFFSLPLRWFKFNSELTIVISPFQLTVSYEVPQILVPVASALQPFLESLLARGLERFKELVKSYSTD
ncbi:unnamed protein product [Camellia sinensis]